MFEQSIYAVAIRWFLYGAVVGAVIDVVAVLGTIWGTKTWQGWQSAAGGLLTTIIEFAIVGMLIGIFRHHLAKRRP